MYIPRAEKQRRVPLALGRLGSASGNGSGDMFIAFSTGNPGAANPETAPALKMVPNEKMDALFEAEIAEQDRPDKDSGHKLVDKHFLFANARESLRTEKDPRDRLVKVQIPFAVLQIVRRVPQADHLRFLLSGNVGPQHQEAAKSVLLAGEWNQRVDGERELIELSGKNAEVCHARVHGNLLNGMEGIWRDASARR
jgi:hypothetical protein